MPCISANSTPADSTTSWIANLIQDPPLVESWMRNPQIQRLDCGAGASKISVSALGPGTNPLQVGRDDYDFLVKPDNVKEITQLFLPFCNGALTF